LQKAIEAIENNIKLRVTVLCEPQLGKRGLYPTFNSQELYDQTIRLTMDAVSFCDGNRSILEIAELLGAPMSKVVKALKPLMNEGLLELTPP
jgi:aminopeptidase-like protein